VALSIALGSSLAISKLKLSPKAASFARFAPFPAVALANVCNTLVMRRSELTDGIPVFANSRDGSGSEMVGYSHAAAKQALADTCITRVAIPGINFVLGPVIFESLPEFAKACPTRQVLSCWAVCYVAFAAGVPLSLALYPTTCHMGVDSLESHLVAKLPPGITTVSYNKGM